MRCACCRCCDAKVHSKLRLGPEDGGTHTHRHEEDPNALMSLRDAHARDVRMEAPVAAGRLAQQDCASANRRMAMRSQDATNTTRRALIESTVE